MPSRADIDVVVFDILGTLVNEPGGLRNSICELAPGESAGHVDALVEVWQSHVAYRQREMLDGRRPYANSDVLDREAAELVAATCGVTDATAIDKLATAARRLDPWPGTVESLERLARHVPLVGLSNASRATLTCLNAHAGLRWHYLLSAEDARSYKPAPDVYRLAVELAGGPPERVLSRRARLGPPRRANTGNAHGLRRTAGRRPAALL